MDSSDPPGALAHEPTQREEAGAVLLARSLRVRSVSPHQMPGSRPVSALSVMLSLSRDSGRGDLTAAEDKTTQTLGQQRETYSSIVAELMRTVEARSVSVLAGEGAQRTSAEPRSSKARGAVTGASAVQPLLRQMLTAFKAVTFHETPTKQIWACKDIRETRNPRFHRNSAKLLVRATVPRQSEEEAGSSASGCKVLHMVWLPHIPPRCDYSTYLLPQNIAQSGEVTKKIQIGKMTKSKLKKALERAACTLTFSAVPPDYRGMAQAAIDAVQKRLSH